MMDLEKEIPAAVRAAVHRLACGADAEDHPGHNATLVADLDDIVEAVDTALRNVLLRYFIERMQS